MKILLDNGHGSNTPGKRSPDGLFREYAYTREIAALVASKLRREGYDAELFAGPVGPVAGTSWSTVPIYQLPFSPI